MSPEVSFGARSIVVSLGAGAQLRVLAFLDKRLKP
jgi:hypothetical protein